MTLPSSGTLSIDDLVSEFGGTAPHSLSEYYRGGGLVPNIPSNFGVPLSGPISLSDFYGATNTPPAVSVTDTTIVHDRSSLSRTVTLTFRDNGTILVQNTNGTITSPALPLPNWLTAGFATDVQIRWTNLNQPSGSNFSINNGTRSFGVWYQITSDQFITISSAAVGDVNGVEFRAEFRNAATTAALDSADYTINLQ